MLHSRTVALEVHELKGSARRVRERRNMSEEKVEATNLVMSNLNFALDEPKEFGPIMVFAIETVISLIVQYCANKHINKIAKSPNLLQRFALRGYIKKSCPDRDFFRKHKDRIYDAVLKSGVNATQEQLDKIFANQYL